MIICASDLFQDGADKRKAAALSLLTAINLAYRAKGMKGCEITEADVREGQGGISILTITARPGEAPATLDDVRRFFSARAS